MISIRGAIFWRLLEFFFPGTEHLDGTIEGAMRAGVEAYPV
jgi:hypothetical protein